MAFVILGDSFTFPEGTAATNHAYTYAKGFIENGTKVHIICTENEYLENYDGITNGILYYHPFAQKERSPYFIMRRWYKFRKYFRTFSLISRIDREEQIIALNLWTYRLGTQLFAYFLAKYFRTKLIIERSEHPLRNYKDDRISQFSGRTRLQVERYLYDGIFCMTNYLIEFYKKAGFSVSKLFLVPSTVDTERFNIKCKSPFDYNYILYCGSLTVLKDGVDILIESFNKISGKYPDLKLVLIGKGDTSEEELLIRNLVVSLHLEKRVIFPGQLPRADIPPYLLNAKILALARPKSKVADAGFPSKLTEYLSTGNPVVVTEVGEIPFYLKDNETAFLSEPDNIDAFAEKVDYVLDNYEYAREVAARGKELTATIFNYNYQARRMLTFINSLNGVPDNPV
jgi:glycosyltransferase involved in cell wall biosynthesis